MTAWNGKEQKEYSLVFILEFDATEIVFLPTCSQHIKYLITAIDIWEWNMSYMFYNGIN